MLLLELAEILLVPLQMVPCSLFVSLGFSYFRSFRLPSSSHWTDRTTHYSVARRLSPATLLYSKLPGAETAPFDENSSFAKPLYCSKN